MDIFPTIAGPYRMRTKSGNSFFVIVDTSFYREGGCSIAVYHPITFRVSTFTPDSEEDIRKEFHPTGFEPLFLYDADNRASDMQDHDATPAEPAID